MTLAEIESKLLNMQKDAKQMGEDMQRITQSAATINFETESGQKKAKELIQFM